MAKKSNTQLVHIRMPTAFHRKLLRDAERSGQTLNAEILRRLEASYACRIRGRGKVDAKWYKGVTEKLSVTIRVA